METIHDRKVRNTERRLVTQACAEALEGHRAFQGGDQKYKLYLQVPTRFLGEDADPGEDGVIDMLVCRAEDGLAVMAVVFRMKDGHCQMPDRLAGIRVSDVPTIGWSPPYRIESSVRCVLTDAGFCLPEDTKRARGTVRLNVRPLEREWAGLRAKRSRGDLVRGQILCPDGAVTAYGAKYGLVLCRTKRKNGWAEELGVVSDKYDEARELLRWSRKKLPPGKVPLGTRLAAAKNGAPADRAYAAHMAEQLDQLLAAPVGRELEAFGAVSEVLNTFPDKDYSTTYGGALEMVHDLVELYLKDGRDTGPYMLAGEIMSALLDWLRKGPRPVPEDQEDPQSVRGRLGDILGTRTRDLVANASVVGYVQGAAARLGTGYPLDIYNWGQGGTLPVKGFAQYLSKQWLREVPPAPRGGQARISGTFDDMYSLLVQPILPDYDTMQLMCRLRAA